MNKTNKKVFTAMVVLLLVCLFPLLLTVLTSVIPEGDLFHIITGKTLLDFETNPMFLRTKMKTIGNKTYELLKNEKSESENTYLEIKNETPDELTGIGIFLGDKNFQLIKSFTCDMKISGGITELFIGIKDIDEQIKILPLEGDLIKADWGKQQIVIPLDRYEGVDLKHVSQLQILFSSPEVGDGICLDNIGVNYKFPTLMNFVNVWEENDFARYMFNSGVISIFTVLGNLILSTMVAYALARKQFRGKEFIFGLILATMMIPPQITIIPIFMMMEKLNWINTFYALIIPTLVTPFGIFLMRQYIEQLPVEIDQAAYVDGANDFQIFFRIILPLSGPGLAVLGINSFITSWNSLYYPLVMTNSKDMRTVQVGLAMFSKLNQVEWPKLMAASTLAGLPVIIIFLIFQKQIISGLVDGAVKS
ncbi:MAG TPA: carbohydrate ABC transporter permease [Thermotogota bacterium]|nr:carbohydrate ABC transporter permease [Thermotogota bacterium]HPJ89494.1 carbohydrate ABC transporter permease [Thermotogota bacterium]HPR96386.1 carbohydrate ABC transporter permease [Thermotogota bacterium]